ncbi:hypothetical protein J7E93_17480 [Streptomyces sp. ISL-36]|uniref:hypothetical protein n=1 Tax=Streptomyces sp. ISL-36 TaxID=2819182 RepID=UPI001BEA59F7|nr:hypothetical protein [Streptomyces sp. ISL-36]MBT2441871.1 hypothetical protein [Streptomyces sp. ISL-36]
MARMRAILRTLLPTARRAPDEPRKAPGVRRPHNIFEAAATYVVGCVEEDQDQIEEAVTWVQPEALSFGINELACRAVIALARERDESPRTVARSLLGLPDS